MSQQLKTITRKDGKATGLATRLPEGYSNNLTIADVFRNVFFGEPINNKITNNTPINDSSTPIIKDYIMRGPIGSVANLLANTYYLYKPNGESKNYLSDYLA